MKALTSFNPRRALSMAKKEVRHVVRDKATLTMALGLPVFLVVFFGYVFDFDVRDIRLAVFDRDQTAASRTLIDVFSSSQYFRVSKQTQSPRGDLALLDQESAKAVLIIEPGFESDLRRGEPASVQLVLDGADNQSSGMIVSYLAGLRQAANLRLTGQAIKQPVVLQTRFLFNSDLNSHWFIIPGLTVVVVGILSILLTALTVAREWENGSMELLLSTPVQPLEIIVGKLAPYTALGFAGIALVYAAARLGFHVPFRGNHVLFGVACLLFLATTLSQGLLISVVTRQQQLAMQLANMTGMLPSMLLSGFIFPNESMPRFFQIVTSVFPAKWFMIICRSLFLKGSSFMELLQPFVALIITNVILLRLATKKFKKDVEP